MSEMDILFPVPDGRRNADDMGNPPDPTAAPAQGEDASGLIVLEGRDTPLPEVWVVWGKAGVDFVAPLEHMAQEHANDAAQDFPDEGPWRVHRYVLPVAASPTAASAQEPRRFDVFRICDAYESGIGHGLKRDGLCNPYPPESDDFRAYDIGYEEGARRAIDDAAPAQGEPTRHLTSDEQQMLGRALRASTRKVTAQGEPQDCDALIERLRDVLRNWTNVTDEEQSVIRDAADAIAALRAERDDWKRKYGDANEWGLRNTAAWKDRAERAEAERDALREVLREVLHATSGNMSMDMYAKVCATLDAARAKVQP